MLSRKSGQCVYQSNFYFSAVPIPENAQENKTACTYSVPFRRVLATVVALEKQ
jgi:hypothetical protein